MDNTINTSQEYIYLEIGNTYSLIELLNTHNIKKEDIVLLESTNRGYKLIYIRYN